MRRDAPGFALVSLGLFIAILIDGTYTGNPGPIHGQVTGHVWWGGVVLQGGGWFLVLSELLKGATATQRGVFAGLLFPGPLVLADHLLRGTPPLLAHTAIAGNLATLGVAAILHVALATATLWRDTWREFFKENREVEVRVVAAGGREEDRGGDPSGYWDLGAFEGVGVSPPEEDENP